MKLLHYTYIAVVALILSACSDIAENERLIYVGYTPEVKPGEIAQNVLIEDFTGQRCMNCPTAANITEQLVSVYGATRIVPVAIHSGSFGVPAPTGLMTTVGQEYFPTGHGQPVGRINRGEAIDDYMSWGTVVKQCLSVPAQVEMKLNTEYATATRTLTITTTAKPKSDISAKYQLWLIEDGITATQIMPDGNPNDKYVHNNVFRDAINGTWGEDFSIAGNDTEATLPTHSYNIPSGYVAANCYVVAFIYNDSGVLQVVKEKVTE